MMWRDIANLVLKVKQVLFLKKQVEICGFDETRWHMSELASKTRSRLRTGMRTGLLLCVCFSWGETNRMPHMWYRQKVPEILYLVYVFQYKYYVNKGTLVRKRLIKEIFISKKQDNFVEAEFSKHLYNLWYLVYLGILVHTQCKIVHTLNLPGSIYLEVWSWRINYRSGVTKSSATKTPHLNYLNYLNYLPNYLPTRMGRTWSTLPYDATNAVRRQASRTGVRVFRTWSTFAVRGVRRLP
jgi:hypothetical protein